MARKEANLIVKKQCECTEQCLGTDYKSDENIWVRIRGHFNLSDIVMDICYKLHGDEEESNNQLTGKQLGRESPWDPANMKSRLRRILSMCMNTFPETQQGSCI